MKQEEIKIQIGKAEYNEDYGFIYSKKIGESKPFAFVYNNRLDQHEIGRFIVDAINDKLASTPKVEAVAFFRWMRNCSAADLCRPNDDGDGIYLLSVEEAYDRYKQLSDLTSEKEEGR